MTDRPDSEKALAAVDRRTTAFAALKHISRLVESEKAEDARTRKFAATTTAVLLGGIGLCFLVMLSGDLLVFAQSGLPAPPSISDAVTLMVATALPAFPLAGACYLFKGYPGPMWRFATAVLALTLACDLLIAALFVGMVPVTGCSFEKQAARDTKVVETIEKLTACLAYPTVSGVPRAHALHTRALAYFTNDEYVPAVQDTEQAFRLRAPTKYEELLTYANYLLAAGRVDDSLNAVVEAERIAGSDAKKHIEYDKGRALLSLGRVDEAIVAFSEVISIDRRSTQAYWQRGVAHEQRSNRGAAKADFERTERLLSSQFDPTPDTKAQLLRVQEKLKKYRSDQK